MPILPERVIHHDRVMVFLSPDFGFEGEAMSSQMAILAHLRRMCGTSVLILLSACASRAPVDPAKLRQVHVISLTGFSDPKFSPMMIGALLTDDDLNEISAKEDLHLGTDLKMAVSTALQNAGYKVQDGNAATSDAVLNVKFGPVSYFAMPIIVGGGFGPAVMIDIHLETAKTGETLMSRTYEYQLSTYTGLTGYLALAADKKYEFDTVDAMEKNPQLVAEGLHAAIPLFARSIASELPKKK